ncbi:PEBP-like protein [Schizopora paradoxa]|uniref:PEBP-like protein n=1 Tax=Schizopora paradoxa TaxID=27342 RepID=A0A0H2R6D9_9AGAM|nr:PEBP-like protein [Schizopora paradoxa]
MTKALFVSLSLISAALAQSNTTNNTAVGIEAIQAHFSNAGIVPSLLATFDPSALMTVDYSGVGDIQPGQALSETQVSPTPSVSITPANSSVQLGSNFTLMMVDADAVGTDESAGQTRHWLVNGVTLGNGTSAENVTTSSGIAITEYAGPAPPSGSGPHRYVILLYKQPDTFTPPANLSTANVGVSVFSLSSYIQETGLEGPVAGMYYTVEEGTATFTPSATSAVVTSTLPVPSGTSSGTASGSGSSPSQSSNSNGASAAFGSISSLFMIAAPVLAAVAAI